jgi:alpha-glucosidase
MYLKKREADSTFYSVLSPHPSNENIAVNLDGEVVTPWRLVMVSNKALNLIGSNSITNLNEACTFKETSWIKPGKSAWDWWNYQTVPENAGFDPGMNNETMKYFIDFAAEFNLEYMLVDAKWYGDHKDPKEDITTSISEIDVPELVKYARERDVQLHLWVNWECLDRQMDEAMALYEKWGVKGIKVDYMNRDDQEMVNFYHKVLEKAAKYHLLVNFHGAYKPTGISRTYPNLMTREGIMGLEHSRWSARITPEHNVTIPYTRMLAGPMDYTPGGFRNVSRENFLGGQKPPMVMGTRCHNLAMFVVYLSPMQMVCDWPGAYRGEKGSEFIKVVPASWDQSLPIEGEIGEYIVIARKKGNEWFLGGMTNRKKRNLEIPVSFLNENIIYEAAIYKDTPESVKNPKEMEIVKKKFSAFDTLNIEMVSDGGVAIHFKPLEKQ